MRLDQMPWPRAGAAGAVKEVIWNARALACNVTRSLECQTRANFFSDTFAVRATDGCTMPCYVYTFIHQFSLSIFDRATTLVIFIVTNDQHHCLMNFFFFLFLAIVFEFFFFFSKINLRNKEYFLLQSIDRWEISLFAPSRHLAETWQIYLRGT